MQVLPCPLCASRSKMLCDDRQRTFFRCCECDLVFADPETHLDRTAEKSVYAQHENDPADERYRRFLGQLARPLLARLQAGMRGLDYGCGPGPTLSVMLEEAGMEMELYDPFFVPDMTVLERQYDFVTCTEVAEHFCRPARDWNRLASLLRPGSWLGVMTRLVDSRQRFDQWYYKNDPTHVSFYCATTFAWLGARYGLAVEHQDHNVVLLLKK